MKQISQHQIENLENLFNSEVKANKEIFMNLIETFTKDGFYVDNFLNIEMWVYLKSKRSKAITYRKINHLKFKNITTTQ